MSTPSGPQERRVRDALHDTVDDLEPVSGLSAIRSRLQEDAMNTRPSRTALLALGGADAVAVVVTGVVLVTQDTDPGGSSAPPAASTTPDVTGTASPSATTGSASASSSPSGAASPSDSSAPMTTRTLPVYYVGTTPVGPRLYREFRRVQVKGGEELAAALRQAVQAPPLDPDYRTPWPVGTRVESVADARSSSDGTISVSLAGNLHDRPAGMSRAVAEMAVQQLVYTAQAVAQSRTPVQLLLGGARTDQLLGVPVSEPLANGDEMSTTGTVWITSPQDGDTVRSGDVVVTGRGAFFEATVVWQLLQGDQVVANGSAMARECCKRSPFDFTIPDVAPGDYTLRVYDEDMSGGEGGRPEAQDTKRITVR
jgi:hypothetical protein